MSRFTFKDAEHAGRRLADALGFDYGHYVTVDDEPGEIDGERPEGRYKVQLRDGRWMTTQPDAIEVDYNPTYGGCVIQQVADDGGTWVSEPFSRERKTPREFVAYVDALIAGMDLGTRHEFQHARFTGTVTCSKCGLLPLDQDDTDSECVR